MIALSYYLLKVTVCSGILYGYYLLALRDRIFHHWNRYYLLATVGLSLLLPLVSIPVAAGRPAEAGYPPARLLQVVTTGDAYVEELRQSPPLQPGAEAWFLPAYLLVSICFLFVLVRTLLRIRSMLIRHEVRTIGGFRFVNTKEEGTPFSFLRYIFWHEDIPMESPAGRQMLTHEMVHVRELHTHDKLFLSTVLVACWCNPFFWLIRREMAMIHEFIADSKTVDGEDTAAFAAMILQAAWPGQRFGLTNPFFHSPIKRRLKMLIRSRNKRVNYLTRILALPLLLLVAAAFTLKPAEHPGAGADPARSWTFVIDAGHGGSDPGVRTDDGVTEKDLALAIARKVRELNENPAFKIILTRETDVLQPLREKVDRTVERNPDAFISIHVNGGGNGRSGFEVFLGSRNREYARENILLGTLINEEIATSYRTLDTLRTRKDAIWVLDAPQIDYPAALVECGYLTNAQDRAWITRPENQERIARNILKALERFAGMSAARPNIMDTVPGLKVQGSVRKVSMTVHEFNPSADEAKVQQLIVVNGKPMSMQDLQSKTIEADSVTVYKANNPKAIRIYGEVGEKGVIEFHDARIWDARPVKNTVVDTLPSDIKTIDVTDDGVILTYRNGTTEKVSREDAYRRKLLPADNFTKNTKEGRSKTYIQLKTAEGVPDTGLEPLYVIDGIMLSKEVARQSLDIIAAPNDIATVNVLKGQSATLRYGDRGQNGVVEIRTKKGKWNGEPLGKSEITEFRIDDGSPAFTKVEVPAKYPGGASTLDSRIRKEVENNDRIGGQGKSLKGQCGIRFFVDKYGGLSGFTVTDKTTNNDLALLVIEILKRGGAWEPALQKGNKVKSVQEIRFKY